MIRGYIRRYYCTVMYKYPTCALSMGQGGLKMREIPSLRRTRLWKGQRLSWMSTDLQSDKPHRCDWEGCDYAAVLPSHLKAHMMTHTGEKPYHCDWDVPPLVS